MSNILVAVLPGAVTMIRSRSTLQKPPIRRVRSSRISSSERFSYAKGGAFLSGGQRQMITVARALVLEPSILLMDEPTSNMDNFAERQFVENMKKWLDGRTLVMVTHRASMLALVDRIILLDKAKIVADGPKDEVMGLLAASKIRGA